MNKPMIIFLMIINLAVVRTEKHLTLKVRALGASRSSSLKSAEYYNPLLDDEEEELDDGKTLSKKAITKMYRNSKITKLVIWAVIAIITLTLFLALYLKYKK